MHKHSFCLLLATAMLAGSGLSSAATIVTNNTGIPNASFSFLDLEAAGDANVAGIGTISNKTSSGGGDPDSYAFGEYCGWGRQGQVTYTFTELVPGQLYQIYANWRGNNDASVAVDVSANGASLGTVEQIHSSAAGTNGFTAYAEATDTATEVFGFALIGTGTADANGDLVIVVSKSKAEGKSHGRFDAIAVAPVPDHLWLRAARQKQRQQQQDK